MSTPFADPADLSPTDEDMVSYASALIRVACDWVIYPAVDATENVEIFIGRCPSSWGPRKLYLSTLKLNSVTSATLPDGTVLGPDDLEFDPIGWVRRADGQRWPSWGTVAFVYNHGYADVPDAIKAVTVSVSKRMPASFSVWTHRKMGTAVVQMAPGVSVVPGSFNVAEQLVLEQYRLPLTRA